MTQKEAASYFGCKQSFISFIETGRSKVPTNFISKILANNSFDKSVLRNVDISTYNNEYGDSVDNYKDLYFNLMEKYSALQEKYSALQEEHMTFQKKHATIQGDAVEATAVG
jgi:transcriptional regulator with XRE-family HTH domain